MRLKGCGDLIDRYIKGAPDLTEEDVIFTYTPEEWTNTEVKIKIESKLEGYTLQYSLDEGQTWNNYSEELTVEENNKVILARLINANGAGGSIREVVDNIDTVLPTTATIAGSDVTTTTATLTATGVDGDETATSGRSGIKKYVFFRDNVEYSTVETTEETAITQLTFEEDSHSCYVVVYDKADNLLASTTTTVTKHTHVDSCYNWTAVTGIYRCVSHSTSYDDSGRAHYSCSLTCNRCGASRKDGNAYCYNQVAGSSKYHCSSNVKGSLKCTL